MTYYSGSDLGEGCAKLLVTILVMVAVWAIVSVLFAYPVMWLWNWLMPAIFNLPTITWTQGWGLMLLSSLLIKGGTTVSKND